VLALAARRPIVVVGVGVGAVASTGSVGDACTGSRARQVGV